MISPRLRSPVLGNVLCNSVGNDFEVVMRSCGGHVEVITTKKGLMSKVAMLEPKEAEEKSPTDSELVEVCYARNLEFLSPEDAARLIETLAASDRDLSAAESFEQVSQSLRAKPSGDVKKIPPTRVEEGLP